jgi:hypothetical protein
MRKMANGIVHEAYLKLLSSTDIHSDGYDKGVIGGLEMLFQNIEDTRDDMKDMVIAEREEEEVEDDTAQRRADALGIGVTNEDI